MTSREIRQSFLDFFAQRGHRIVPSAPVIPHGDATLLFTNAGMNQFKDVFLGQGKRDYTRAADTQKCIRVSGKHNDLEEVGYDTYHHTFFEMLGNWSFGDYFKNEAIGWSWELLTDVWKLPAERLHATVYRTDDEAYEIWKRYLPEAQIHRFDDKDNFWEMGETGPCGPCSEIHFDRTPDLSGGPLVNAGVPEVIEIWNNVFIQFNRKADGSLEDLPSRHVDTGMGFERVTAVMQGKDSNYDSDIFQPLISLTEQISGRSYRTELDNPDGVAMRVVADHVRTLAFAIADGAIPGNEGRGYVLRRILRRAARYARNLGITEPVLWKHVAVLCDTMGDVFPELVHQRSIIERIIRAEEEQFMKKLDEGSEMIWDWWKQTVENAIHTWQPPVRLDHDHWNGASREGRYWGVLTSAVYQTPDGPPVDWKTAADISRDVASTGGSPLEMDGDTAFKLYDTFGFPLDLTQLMCRELFGIGVDTVRFETLLEEQRARSRAARKATLHDVHIPTNIEAHTAFTGYTDTESASPIVHIQDNAVVTAASPFYVEMGGQVSDTGTLVVGGTVYDVLDVRKSGDAIVHICDVTVDATLADVAIARLDVSRRRDIQREHSATHLLHEALRRVLGTHIQQAGSLVAPDRLRFDFSHFEKVRPDELQAIENMVNEKIFEGIDVHTEEMSVDKARTVPGAKMFFGDKYGDTVRVVFIDEKFSVEFCGGTHVRNTSDIGMFRILGESSVASGVRRIEAIAGRSIHGYLAEQLQRIADIGGERDAMAERVRQLERELASLRTGELKNVLPPIVAQARISNGIRIATGIVQASDADQLKELGDALRGLLKEQGIGVLASVLDGKVQLVGVVTDDLTKVHSAGKIVGAMAKRLGGGGGGKPHLATAGGKDVDALPSVLDDIENIISQA